jgi:pimeloyl-ACP methyl ester carboxylesterase
MNDPVELAAIDRGAGPTVALVHGGVIHSGPAWAKSLGPLIDAGYRVIAVDRRGHGRSPKGDVDHASVHLHADDLRLTLELREAGPAHLVGVSYGCLVCLEFARSWPDRVISMTLSEPSLLTLLEGDPDYKEWLESFAEIERLAREGAALEEWFPKWLNLIDGRMARATTPAHPTWSLVERHAHLVFQEEPGWKYSLSDEDLSSIIVPILVVNGDLSEPPMQAIGEILASKLPNATHSWVKGGGHDLHARRPEAFNGLLIDFLSKQQR